MVDVVAILLIVIAGVVGYIAGFGKVLKFLSDGILGKILTVVVCYFLFGTVLAFPFVQKLMGKLMVAIDGVNSKFLDFLFLTVRLDLILYAGGLFVAVTFLRKLVVFLIETVVETDSKPMKILNRVGGTLLSLFWFSMIVLIIFQILAWITGIDGPVYQFFNKSFFLGHVFQGNPLNAIIQSFDINAILDTTR